MSKDDRPKRTAPNVKSTYNPAVDGSFADLVKEHLGRELPTSKTKGSEEMITQSNSIPRWVQILGLILSVTVAGWGPIVGMFIWLNGQFSDISSNLARIESSVTAKIETVETKFDNKFDNLSDMMILAHTNGEVTEAELVEIWEKVSVSE